VRFRAPLHPGPLNSKSSPALIDHNSVTTVDALQHTAVFNKTHRITWFFLLGTFARSVAQLYVTKGFHLGKNLLTLQVSSQTAQFQRKYPS
jgi:hypothetical protein